MIALNSIKINGRFNIQLFAIILDRVDCRRLLCHIRTALPAESVHSVASLLRQQKTYKTRKIALIIEGSKQRKAYLLRIK